MINYWLEGLRIAFQPLNLLIMLVGVASGIVVGALPGVTSSMGIILLLPFTYYMKPETALLMLTGMYCASMFGGSIAAILLRTPGTPSAAATSIDGYPLALQGKAGKAISAALIGSFFGGIASGVCMVFLGPAACQVRSQVWSSRIFRSGGVWLDHNCERLRKRPAQGSHFRTRRSLTILDRH